MRGRSARCARPRTSCPASSRSLLGCRATTTRSSASTATPTRRDQEVVPAARARAAPGRQRARPGGRGEVQGGRRGLRGALRRRAPPDLRRLRPRRPEDRRLLAQLRGLRVDPRPLQRVLRAGRVRRGVRRTRMRGGAVQGGDVGWRWRSPGEAARGTRSRSPTTPRRCARPATATAPSRARRSSPAECNGAGQIQAVQRTRFGQMVRTALCDKCGGDGRIAEQPCHTCDGARDVAGVRGRRSTSRPGSTTGSGCASPAVATRASAAGRPATSTWSCGSRRTSASSAIARTS